MYTRRQFLSASGLAAAGAAVSGCNSATSGNDLPPSIAALESMKDQARPITTEERAGRIEKARKLMRENGMDALLLAGGTSLVYFSNVRWWLSERMFGLILPVTGDPFVVCPAFEEDRAREQLATGPLGGTTVRTWQEHENPHEKIAEGLKELGLSNGTIGIEETVWYAYSNGLARAAPGVTQTSGTPVTAGCRMVKDAHELELMQLASTVTYRAYEAAYHALEEGMTQDDFARLVSTAHTRLGFSGGAGVQVGEFSALPHGSVTPQTIREGTILLIDGGCKVEGYASDLSRTFVLGNRPTK